MRDIVDVLAWAGRRGTGTSWRRTPSVISCTCAGGGSSEHSTGRRFPRAAKKATPSPAAFSLGLPQGASPLWPSHQRPHQRKQVAAHLERCRSYLKSHSCHRRDPRMSGGCRHTAHPLMPLRARHDVRFLREGGKACSRRPTAARSNDRTSTAPPAWGHGGAVWNGSCSRRPDWEPTRCWPRARTWLTLSGARRTVAVGCDVLSRDLSRPAPCLRHWSGDQQLHHVAPQRHTTVCAGTAVPAVNLIPRATAALTSDDKSAWAARLPGVGWPGRASTLESIQAVIGVCSRVRAARARLARVFQGRLRWLCRW